MPDDIVIRGLRDLATYFSKTKVPGDDDPEHVTMAELEGARGRISADADHVIESMRFSGTGYYLLTAMQTEGWFNDHTASLADLRAASTGIGDGGKSAKKAQESLVATLRRTGRAFDRVGHVAKAFEAARKNRNLGDWDTSGMTAALIAIGPPKTAESYDRLSTSGTSFGDYDVANTVRAILAANPGSVDAFTKLAGSGLGFGDSDLSALVRAILATGPADAAKRFAAISSTTKASFGDSDNAGLVRAILATGPADALERYTRLPALSYGDSDNAGVVRALLATGPAAAVERFRALSTSNVRFGDSDEAGIVRAILATGPAGALQRFEAIAAANVSFGDSDVSHVAMAMLAVGPKESLERYIALGELGLSFGDSDWAPVVRAALATGTMPAWLIGVLDGDEADDEAAAKARRQD
jgi:hypothetical protein